MQFKIAKILNSLLIVITVIILALAGLYLVVYFRYPAYKTPYLIGFVVVAVALFWLFWWLESRWDKSVITKMARNGKVGVARLKSAKRVLDMRDTSFTKYWLYEFKGDLLTPELVLHQDVTFYEKMNVETQEVPEGTVFVTYDEKKPAQIFIIPNALISHLPELMPAVQKMENSKKLPIKYLDAFYKKGMVVRTFQETLAEQRHAQAHKELEEQQAGEK